LIDSSTQVCISVASKPSNFGTALHNAGYEALGLNFLYKAFAVSDIAAAITGVRALGIRGCSVSMPFKESVIPHLDRVDDTASAIGAANTVVNDNGVLTGYNTDVTGALTALQAVDIRSSETILLLGAGGAARAILFALAQLQINQVRVASRSAERVASLAMIARCESVVWEDRHAAHADVIINATPVGMRPAVDVLPVDRSLVDRCRAVMDVVLSPMETALVQYARAAGKVVVPGYVMSLGQALAQFRLYTGVEPPRAVMERRMRQLLDQ
jgi:shikimate dehydrogenase